MSETTKEPNVLSELLKWPTREEDVTVDGILRIVGADTQRDYLRKLREMDTHGVQPTELYFSRTLGLISGVGLMACLRALREVSPERADAFARDYWGMCDAGDSFGEFLWEYLEAAGLDPALIKLADEVAQSDATPPETQEPT